MWTASARCQYERLSERCASDATDAEFALIAPLLPQARRDGRRRTTDLRDVLNAILYMIRTGCQWRMLPKEFPPRSMPPETFHAHAAQDEFVERFRIRFNDVALQTLEQENQSRSTYR